MYDVKEDNYYSYKYVMGRHWPHYLKKILVHSCMANV